MVKTTDQPYKGSTRSLILAFDVGTTFSAISYAILEPGEVPRCQGVTCFPGQEDRAGSAKIPSVIVYDKTGAVRAAGAEADNPVIQEAMEDEGWTRVEWFKLHLRPKQDTNLKLGSAQLPRLPHKKTAIGVFADFLAYLLHCAQIFIQDTHADGRAMWQALRPSIQFILTHPNGWTSVQQSRMRKAAVEAELVTASPEGQSRIKFLTEGEASLQACVASGLADNHLKIDNGFIIADLGGGTLDMSAYKVTSTAPFRVVETATPECRLSGSALVSRRAKQFFKAKLVKSRYGAPDSINHITRVFDETTKRVFRSAEEPAFVVVGNPMDKDLEHDIRRGKLKVTGAEVASLFEHSVTAAEEAIRAQFVKSDGVLKAIFLVGGFAGSPYLFNQLQIRLSDLNVEVSRPDGQESKAVANGAVGFVLEQYVKERISKYTYGMSVNWGFNPGKSEHVRRQSDVYIDCSGERSVRGGFCRILEKDTLVTENSAFARAACRNTTDWSQLQKYSLTVQLYDGQVQGIEWYDQDPDLSNFRTLCTVEADLTQVCNVTKPSLAPNGTYYYRVVIEIVLNFGLTEFSAVIRWVRQGQTCYGPATVIFNEDGEVEDDPADFEDDESEDDEEEGHELRLSSPPNPTKPDDRVLQGNGSLAGTKDGDATALPQSSTGTKAEPVVDKDADADANWERLG